MEYVADTEVTADEWNAAFAFNAENYTGVFTATMGEERQRVIIEKTANAFSKTAGWLTGEEMTDADEHYYAKEGDSYYHYWFEDEQWYKGEMPQDEYESAKSDSFAKGFDFADFTYNAETKRYECANGTLDDWQIQNIAVAFEDGQLTDAKYTRVVTAATIDYHFAYTYGGAEVTLPQAIEKTDDTEVTAEEWQTALALECDNYTLLATVKQPGIVAEVLTKYSDGIFYQNEDGEESYVGKDGDKYYKYAYENEEWHKYKITEDDYNELMTSNLSSMFSFADFTYDSADKVYKAAAIGSGPMQLTNVELAFLDNQLISVKYTLQGIIAQLTLTYGDAEIELPTPTPVKTIRDDDMLASAFAAALDTQAERTVYLAMYDPETNTENPMYEVRVTENLVYTFTSAYERIYQKLDDGTIHVYMKYTDGAWTEEPSTGASYRPWEYLVNSAVTMGGHGEYAVGTDSLDNMIYNATEKCYMYTAIYDEEDGSQADYQAYFIDGELVKLEVFIDGVKQYVFTYDYEVEEIQIPEV